MIATQPTLIKTCQSLASVCPALAFTLLFPEYLIQNTFFWICLVTLPFSIIRSVGHVSPHFSISLTVAVLSILLPTKTGAFVFMIAFVLFVVQQQIGGLHYIALFHAFLASPFFMYISNVISFPIRIQLSQWVSYLLQKTGFENEVSGNLISIDGQEFLVDQACSGLYLLGYGMLFGTLILSLRLRTRPLSFGWIIGLYIFLIALIIWGNVVRIYLLVLFDLGPEHPMHETVGLFIYTFQILLPFYGWVHRGRFPQVMKQKTIKIQPVFPVTRYLLLAVLFGIVVTRIYERSDYSQTFHTIALVSFKKESLKNDVIKMYNHEALVYIKKPVPAYSAEHNPAICWTGSGYSFTEINQISTADFQVNTGVLTNGADQLHTAWWFESARHQTISQWDWRMKALSGQEHFYLINVTCKTREALLEQVASIYCEGVIKPVSAPVPTNGL